MNSENTNVMDVMELYSKPASYIFNEEEKSLIRKKLQKNSFVVRYAFQKREGSKFGPVTFIIDSMPNTRRSAIENHWEYHSERPLSNIEYEEQVSNFGTCHRRFQVWTYDNIEQLINEDKKYNVKTPKKFVDECKNRGYSGSFQLKMNI